MLYQPTPADLNDTLDPSKRVFEAARSRFGAGVVHDVESKSAKPIDFAVERDDGEITSSLQESQVMGRIPAARFDYVFVIPEMAEEAARWLRDNRRGILSKAEEES